MREIGNWFTRRGGDTTPYRQRLSATSLTSRGTDNFEVVCLGAAVFITAKRRI